MADRYYSETPITDQTVVLAGPEAHHLLHVMRAKIGQQIIVIDGTGYEFQAEITHTSRSDVTLEVLAKEKCDREHPIELTLATALPKGDRQRWLVEKAVELGITNLVPLKTARSVAQPVEKAIARLRRTAIEATKQCGRTRVMNILPSCSWQQILEQKNESVQGLLAHPGGSEQFHQFKNGLTAKSKIILAIGPEGGFTDEEVQQAQEVDWEVIDLGPRILRVETAAAMLTALVLVHGTDSE